MSANLQSVPELRAFDDTDATRKLIYDSALQAVKSKFPIEDDQFRLELTDVRYDGPTEFTLDQQKRAILYDRQLRTPMVGKWRLIDKSSGRVLEEREDVVMHVPYYTPRGTFIYRGNEYSLVNQARLKPGVYVRKKKSGEIETHFNVEPGTGVNFRIFLEPKTGIFRTQIGQSLAPAYPLFKALGVSDDKLKAVWGPELLEKNIKAGDKKAFERLYSRLILNQKVNTSPLTAEDKYNLLKEKLLNSKLDPSVVKATLGLENATGINSDVLLRSTQKMLNVFKGEEEEDDRDSPRFSNYYGPEDFIEERIRKDAGNVLKSLLFKLRRTKSLKAIPRGALNSYIDSFIHGSGLAQTLEETNPLHTLEQMHRIIKTGEGGISSAEAITNEAREVNPGQFGFIDPVHGPERMSVGIDVRAAYGTYKGRDKQIYGEFKNVKTGKIEYLNPQQVYSVAVAFPGEMEKAGDTAVVMLNGKLQRVPKSEVAFEVPSIGHMFSPQSNLNLMPTGFQPGRLFYASKFWSQYMPQVKGEVPLVDSLMPDGKTTFSEYYGKKVGSLLSKVDGVVTAVDDNFITITDQDGKKHKYELIKDFAFNRMTGFSLYPSVKVGDKVSSGQVIAHSNFTDKNTGALTLGVNLKTAIIPAHGYSYEDAYVISESAAKKLANQRIYGFDQDAKNGIEISKDKYISLFPSIFTKEQIANIDEHGVVKPGTVVKFGDPLILAVGPKLLSSTDAQLGSLHKVLRRSFTNKAIIWDQEAPGVVTDVAITPYGAKVNVKSEAPVTVGDKLSTRFGLKGVVGRIIPDEQMPRDPVTNEPYELLLNPMGILSRVAPAQIIEMSLAKIAKKTGKPVLLPQMPPPEGWALWAKKQMEAAGIPTKTDLFDPETGKIIKGVGDGYVYVSAFHHLAENKLSARGGVGSGGYTVDFQPAKGGPTGSKKFSTMDINAALAHGATEVIRDVITIRGNKDEEFWKALKLGRPLPEPKVPFVYEKFLNLLKAGGINIREKGDVLSLLPMTDADIDALSKGEIKSGRLVDNDFEPIAGGLFDVGVTGGMAGNRWAHISLAEPIPNPVMEEPIRRVLGLTKSDLRDIIAGRKQLNGKTGGAAIKEALASLDVDKLIKEHRDKIFKTRGALRDNSIKILGYLTAAKKQKLSPKDWVISKVPVLPPIFRPVSSLGSLALVADLNELYRDIIELNNSIKDLKLQAKDLDISEEKEKLYDAVSAAFGLSEPAFIDGKSKRLKGAIRQVIGENPKSGLFQSKVISKPVDTVGRGVVTPDPNLDMDSIGIPEDSAWAVYKDFVMRRMVRRGFSPVQAITLIEARAPEAKNALIEEMSERPVIVNRAPTWHKFNLLAFYPHIVKGHTIRVSPLVTSGFTMDFDGDQANFHVPVSDKAVRQAIEKMLPSKNLFSLTDLRSIRHAPTQEMAIGIYYLTRPKSTKPPVRFKTLEDARRAYLNNQININDPIIIG